MMMKPRLSTCLLPAILCLPIAGNAAVLWDSFTVTVDSALNPTQAIVDVANLRWTSVSPVPTTVTLEDEITDTTLYFFSGAQQASDGTVVPNDQAFFTFNPALAAEVLAAYQAEHLYIGLYDGPTLVAGKHARPTNSILDVSTPEPWLAWPTGLALTLFAFQRKKSLQ